MSTLPLRGEGQARSARERVCQSIGNRSQYGIGAGKNIMIPKTNDAVAFALEKRSAPLVVCARGVMLTTIDLDDQLGCGANEVGTIGTDWHLRAKFPSFQAARAHARA